MASEHYLSITTREGSYAEEKPLSGRWIAHLRVLTPMNHDS
jgi:hypothetical protein